MSRFSLAIRALKPAQVDAAVAAFLVVIGQVEVWSAATSGRSQALSAVAYLALCGAVAVRRRWPIGAAVIPFLVTIATRAAGGGLLSEATAPLVAIALLMFTIGSREPSARGIAALVGIVALMWIYNAVAGSIATNLLFTTLLATLPWGLGRLLVARQQSIADYRELSERVDAERDKRAHTAIVGERLRIARELHDVVGHSLSVMIVQSGGARRVLAADPTRATAMLSAVERIGHETLDELRRMLGVLGAADEPAALSPQPGLVDVGKAVERARAAGLRVELRIVGDPVPLSPGLDLSAYRIVQEALTNAIKHAGPTRATVTVRWSDAQLELDIVDEGNGARSSPAGDGNGLIGMHERVGLFGGRLEAGPLPTRGFAVHAALPIEPAESVT